MSIDRPLLRSWRIVLACLALVGSSCLELQRTRESTDGTCTTCHGDARRPVALLARAAPPKDLDGNRSTSRIGVGAHERHLFGNGHAKVACADCHVVPESVFAAGHVDSGAPAELVFSGVATTHEHKPKYDHKTRDCKNTYCHRSATVDWTKARSEKDACGTCHGLPPALPHPQRTQCSDCHGEVIARDGAWLAAERHVDGKLDVNTKAKCSLCHGTDPNSGAPPPDLTGGTKPSSRGVGAHEQHLKDSATHRAVACSECHRVPDDAKSDGHIDADGRAEINFGVLATTQNNSPIYLEDRGSCNNTYCHGVESGRWQTPRTPTEACGSCHGLPPKLPHTQLTQCSNCHGRVIARDNTIIEPSLHVDGIVETDFTNDCSGCHGTGPSGSPPPDLLGNTTITARGVGAHAVHLDPGTTHGAIACSECHRVPRLVTEPTHLDGDGKAEVLFGNLATTSGYHPTYDSSVASCTKTYCHRDSQPLWQAPRSSEFACGSCHELPPKAPHPNAVDCSRCHGTVLDASRVFIAPALHVNGRIDVSQVQCNSCHGTDASGAPPPDSSGNTVPSARGVGAHRRHTEASLTHGIVLCSECHRVPSTWDSPGHIDTSLPAEITFGDLAKANTATPKYLDATLTCTGSYCHGGATPNWTIPRTDATTCGTCHALPPKTHYSKAVNCSLCHGEVINASRTFSRPELHVDGTVQVVPNCAACHGSSTNAAPPVDLGGNANVSFLGVGAHQTHLSGGRYSRPLDCSECHWVPTTINAQGHLDVGSSDPAEVRLIGPAAAQGYNPLWNRATVTCIGSYCHGPTDTANRSPNVDNRFQVT